MSQLSENKQYSIEEILEKLRSEAQKMPVSPTSFRYLRALESFASSIAGTHGPYAQEPSTECGAGLSSGETIPETDPVASLLRIPLTDWLINLWLTQTPFSTASLYLDIISALYGSAVKADYLPSTELFTRLKADLKTLGSKGWSSGINEEIFARALRLTKNANLLLLDDSIAADLVILSLTHNLLPLEQFAQLRREDLEEAHDSIVCTIAERQLKGNGRRKYIFPLRQPERSDRQLKKHITKIANALFRRARLPQSTDPNQTVEALWAYAALRTGVPASRVVAYLDHVPLGLPVLKLVGNCVVSEDLRLKTEDLVAIGRVFLDNPPRWYALSLRPGVRFTQLCRRLEILDDRVPQPQLFYPCEEIARAIGKKIVIKQRPFIHSVVFFQAKLTDIGPLLSKIGDLAWCYRESARPGAPYAEISQRQFRLFQQTIATFTPDYEVAPTGELELKKNDRVQIVGGLFAGHTASFDSVAHGTEASSLRPQSGQASNPENSTQTPEPTVYRLNIIGDNGIEWRIHADSRLLGSLPNKDT